ncbi:MAG: AsnC family transcriptional regulator [Candidatus Thermoplasmatota archaeon]
MDALDIRILRTMAIRPFGAEAKDPRMLQPPRLARALGVTVDTVKARLRRMQEAGLLAGFQILPNLRHLQRTGSAWLFQVPEGSDKEAAVQSAREVDGLLGLHDYLGRAICLDFAYRDTDDLRQVLDQCISATGDIRPRRFYDWDMPKVDRSLTAIDWRIIQALRGRAMRPLSEVATELGLALRTVKRRHDQMAHEGSFFIGPLLDPGRARGILLFELVFRLRGEATRATLHGIREAFANELVFAHVPHTGQPWNFNVLLHAESAADVDGLARRGAALPGVEAVEPWLIRQRIEGGRWIDHDIPTRVPPVEA